VITPSVSDFATHVYYNYTIRTSRRDDLRRHLAAHSIGSEIGYGVPVPLEPAYGALGCRESGIRVPGRHDILTPFVYPLAGQLISYYAELARPGGNPDIRRTNLRPYARAFWISQSWTPEKTAHQAKMDGS